MADFKELNLQQPLNVVQMELEVLEYWEKHLIFQKSVADRPISKQFVFYDGPPFATGLPHYGHILASTIKDVVPRYQTMMGHRVERKWGWDCHGLPIENIIEKELNLADKQAIETYGIDRFNEACRNAVMRYAAEWKKVITRLGRWVDMDNDYKTMDPVYMESLWWIFKSLWNKGLIYHGHKSMHICPRCVTPLSNFEVTQGYKDIKDISVIAKFKLKNSNDYILAWTTTPWTLPGNVLLALNPKTQYVRVKLANDDAGYILAKDRMDFVLEGFDYTLDSELNSSELEGLAYEPLFPYFQDTPKAFRTVFDDFVTLEEGTGIVHIAPAFGEDDYRIGKQEDIPLVQHVTMEGKFVSEVTDFAGLSVKPKDDPVSADAKILKYLDIHGGLFKKINFTHSYPHCWRCDTPLINYATSSWFVAVTKIKDQLISNNQQINWYPNHMKTGRFGKWLEGARDWAISRTRYWGTPLPIWQSDDGDLICIESKAELEALSGQAIPDLHKHFVDKVTFEKNGKTYHRIPDVLDCWFESGAMPFASNHYPFENKQKFEQTFPAEFISEGQDQTRGWFYTLHVLATALTESNQPAIPLPPSSAFKNVLVSGIVLAEDGKKMSKRLNNYPDPMLIADKYGVDSLRLYLMTSPVVRAENLNFSEKGVDEVKKKVINLLWNIFTFYKLYDNGSADFTIPATPSHILDRWLVNRLNQVSENYQSAMQKYDIVSAGRLLTEFIREFSTWWLRLSRTRLKDSANNSEVLQVFRSVFYHFILLCAPFIPFISEYIYQHLKTSEAASIHLEMFPDKTTSKAVGSGLSSQMVVAQTIVEKIHSLRKSANLKTRQPLAKALVTAKTPENPDLSSLITNETNIKQLVWTHQPDATDIQVDLDITLTPELIEEGIVREIIRSIQSARKIAQIKVDDIIEVTLPDWPETYTDEIKEKVKAISITKGDELQIRCIKV